MFSFLNILRYGGQGYGGQNYGGGQSYSSSYFRSNTNSHGLGIGSQDYEQSGYYGGGSGYQQSYDESLSYNVSKNVIFSTIISINIQYFLSQFYIITFSYHKRPRSLFIAKCLGKVSKNSEKYSSRRLNQISQWAQPF